MSILKLKKVVIILDEFKNNLNCDDRLYELLKDTLDQQKEILKSNNETLSKYCASMDETLLLMDGRIEKESKEKLDTMKHMSTENKWTVVITCGIVCFSFVLLASIYLFVYFLGDWEASSTSTSISSSTAMTSTNKDVQNNGIVDSGGDLDNAD